ncbi:MAG: hypothetical protein ACRD1V_14090, partial [Vicinamibacterales bacterium]
PLHALSLAAAPARADRMARVAALARGRADGFAPRTPLHALSLAGFARLPPIAWLTPIALARAAEASPLGSPDTA